MDRVKAVIAERGVKSMWLASQIGVSPAYLSHILAGRRRPPAGFFSRVAKALRVRVSDIRPPDPVQSPVEAEPEKAAA